MINQQDIRELYITFTKMNTTLKIADGYRDLELQSQLSG